MQAAGGVARIIQEVATAHNVQAKRKPKTSLGIANLKVWRPDVHCLWRLCPSPKVYLNNFGQKKKFGLNSCYTIVEPEVLQSGFGVNFWIFAWRSLGKLPATVSAN